MERARNASRNAARTTRSAAAVAGAAVGPALTAGRTEQLKQRVTELIAGGRDDAIAALIDRPEYAGDSLRVRRAAESAASTLCVERNGIETYANLFIVSFVIVFDDEVPETQIDAWLRKLLLSRALRVALQATAGARCIEHALVLEEVFALEELVRLPLSRVRRAAEAANEGRLALAIQRFGAGQDHAPRRSGAFVRFLIGQRTSDNGPGAIEAPDLRAPSRQIADAMRERTKVNAHVSARLNHEFFDGLFAGMWRYQAARISQVCRRASEDPDRNRLLRARTETYGSASDHGVRLSLHDVRAPGCLSRHRIAGRPGTPLVETLQRVVKALHSAGVEHVESVRCALNRQGPGEGGCLCHGMSSFAAAI